MRDGGVSERTAKAAAKLDRILRREVAGCAKCGACAAVCPVYAEMRHEAFCARGKLMLARALVENRLESTDSLQDIFNNCLMCLACVQNCGSGVRVDEVVTAARELLLARQGRQLAKRAVLRHVLPKPARLAAVMKGGGALQPLVFSAVPETSGLRMRFPLPFLPPDLPIPKISRRPFTERASGFNQEGGMGLKAGVSNRKGSSDEAPTPESAGEIVYFSGCAANYLYPVIGESLLYILRKAGYSVRVPKDTVCCGTPAAVAGESEVAQRLAEHNLERLAALPGIIVTTCGSCGLMLRREYPRMFAEKAGKDAPDAARAAETAARCLDVSEVLVKKIGTERLSSLFTRKVGRRISYHDPCHLGRGLGLRTGPRSVLKLLARDFAEMEDAERCCGSGGTYGMAHWPESREILRKKMRGVASAGAEILATGCPSCMIQLTAGGRIAGCGTPVFHTAELAAWAMGYEPADEEEKSRFSRLEAT
jgi:glycolate oxidase iron-sulfur subunit